MTKQKAQPTDTPQAKPGPQPEKRSAGETPQPQEKGGPKGPEPTRYGDWENNGRCTDF